MIMDHRIVVSVVRVLLTNYPTGMGLKFKSLTTVVVVLAWALVLI